MCETGLCYCGRLMHKKGTNLVSESSHTLPYFYEIRPVAKRLTRFYSSHLTPLGARVNRTSVQNH